MFSPNLRPNLGPWSQSGPLYGSQMQKSAPHLPTYHRFGRRLHREAEFPPQPRRAARGRPSRAQGTRGIRPRRSYPKNTGGLVSPEAHNRLSELRAERRVNAAGWSLAGKKHYSSEIPCSPGQLPPETITRCILRLHANSWADPRTRSAALSEPYLSAASYLGPGKM